MRTPLHPQAFRHQVAQDNELYKEMQAEKTHKNRLGKYLDWIWCGLLSTSAIDVVTRHETIWIPVALMGIRIFWVGVATIWSARSANGPWWK